MKVMLETSVCIDIMRGQRPRDDFRGMQFLVSSVTEAELWAGVHQAGGTRERDKVERLLSAVEVVFFDSMAAEQSGLVLGGLAKRGSKIGDFDSLIAGHSLALRLPLVTGNVRHFSLIEGLEILDWN